MCEYDGSGIRLTNDSSRAQGAGWTAANSVVWNSEGDKIEAQGPEGAENIVQRSAEPLYETQLVKRTGQTAGAVDAIAAAGRVPEFHSQRRRRGRRKQLQSRHRQRKIRGRRQGALGRDGERRLVARSGESGSTLDAGGVAITRFVPGEPGPG